MAHKDAALASFVRKIEHHLQGGQLDLDALDRIAPFDYSQLDDDTRQFVEHQTDELKVLVKRSTKGIIEIGERLIEVKAQLGHGRFGAWLEAEFDWSERTAQNFMQVAMRFKFANFADLSITPSALYLLSAPSTPDEAIDEAFKRANNGQHISHKQARKIVDSHKPDDSLPDTITGKDGKVRPAVMPAREESGKLIRGAVGNYRLLSNGIKQCERCQELWAADLDYCPYCHVSQEARIAHVQAERKKIQSNSMAIHYSSETPEWYTPRHIIDRVVQVLGEIDLDPCSNSAGDPNVPARHHLTKEDDGLAHPWYGRVYMNPPYGREIADWVNRLHEQWQCGNVTEAITLVPARTDTAWFRVLREFPRCFITGRLKFSENGTGAPFPSAAFYLGNDFDTFKQVFSDVGDIYTWAGDRE